MSIILLLFLTFEARGLLFKSDVSSIRGNPEQLQALPTSNNDAVCQRNDNNMLGHGNNCQNCPQTTWTQFEGKIIDLKLQVYDLGGQSGVDVFVTMTCEIAEYVTRTYKGVGDFLTVMDPDTLAFEVLVDPAATPPPITAGITMVEIWKLSLKRYSDWMVQCKEAMWQAYSIMLGQCSQTMHDCLNAARSWNTINGNK